MLSKQLNYRDEVCDRKVIVNVCRDPSCDWPPVLWTSGRDYFLNSGITVGSPVRRTTQSALHVMLLSYYIGMCVFHERQRDICRRRA